MPLYEYLCGSCGHRFERIQKFSDPPVTECPSCGAHAVEKQVSSPAIQFKGSGWYITDYAKSGSGKDKGEGAGKPASTSTDSGTSSSDKPAGTDSSSSTAATRPATPPPAKTE